MPSSQTHRPVVLVVGPTASGKSTVVRDLDRRRLARVHPTWTTRPRRADEAAGSVEHRFVGEAVFERLDRRGLFLATARPFGLPYRYGLARFTVAESGPLDLVILRAPFVAAFQSLFPCCRVYQIAARQDLARRRLAARGGTEADRARREDHGREVATGARVADRVFDGDQSLDELVDEVAAALAADAGDLVGGRR